MSSPFMMVLYSLLAGFAVLTLLTFALQKLLARTVPAWAGRQASSTPGAVLVNLGFAFMAAVAAGYVAAWVGRDNPMGGVLALAVVVVLMGAVGVLERRARVPLWFQLLVLVLSPAGVVVGGLLRLKAMGLKWAGFEF